MNKRIAVSMISIFAALSVMGGATYAFFSSSAQSTNNVFAAGELELLLDDNDESTPSATVSASFGGSNLMPGDSVSGFLSLHNSGSSDIVEIKFGANNTAINDNGTPSNLADVLDLNVKTGDDNTCTTGAVDHTGLMATFVGDGFSPLTLTELNLVDYDSLPGVAVGQTKYLCMTATFRSSAGNEYQGDSITEDFVFEAHQDVSQ